MKNVECAIPATVKHNFSVERNYGYLSTSERDYFFNPQGYVRRKQRASGEYTLIHEQPPIGLLSRGRAALILESAETPKGIRAQTWCLPELDEPRQHIYQIMHVHESSVIEDPVADLDGKFYRQLRIVSTQVVPIFQGSYAEVTRALPGAQRRYGAESLMLVKAPLGEWLNDDSFEPVEVELADMTEAAEMSTNPANVEEPAVVHDLTLVPSEEELVS